MLSIDPANITILSLLILFGVGNAFLDYFSLFQENKRNKFILIFFFDFFKFYSSFIRLSFFIHPTPSYLTNNFHTKFGKYDFHFKSGINVNKVTAKDTYPPAADIAANSTIVIYRISCHTVIKCNICLYPHPISQLGFFYGMRE